MTNVTKTYLPPLEEYVSYLQRIWATSWVTNNGPLVRELEASLATALGVARVHYVTNGTIALQIALKALGVRGEVITTPYTYVATTTSILWEHCTPVFVDIDPLTLCIDPNRIEASISERTTAILATHVYGYPCGVADIAEVARRHGLRVVYDAAHAFGVRLRGASILNHGDASTLSFHATKLFHTVEGGAIVTTHSGVQTSIDLLRAFGHRGDEYLSEGINGKNSEFHAAMGLCMLPRLGQQIEDRRMLVERYDGLLDGGALYRPAIPDGVEYNFAYYPVVFSSTGVRVQVQGALEAAGVRPRRYFWPSLNRLPYLNGAECPVSESTADRVLCLPLYSELEVAMVESISAIVRDHA